MHKKGKAKKIIIPLGFIIRKATISSYFLNLIAKKVYL